MSILLTTHTNTRCMHVVLGTTVISKLSTAYIDLSQVYTHAYAAFLPLIFESKVLKKA